MTDYPSPAIGVLERTINAAINRLLALDPAAMERLRALEGRTMLIELRDWGRRHHATIRDARFELLAAGDQCVDVTLRGGAADFIALARANRRGEAIGAGRIEISGDLAVAQDVQNLLAELEPDIEQWLASRVGDTAAHRIGRTVRGLLAAGERSAHQLEQDIGDYLRHELLVLPMSDEIERFKREVFALDDAVERSAARIDALRQREALNR